jgi:hypothetical protein
MTIFARDDPHLLLPLWRSAGRRAADHAPFEMDLVFPRDKTFIAHRFFFSTRYSGALDVGVTDDMVLNLFGFVPLGLVWAALLRKRHSAWATLLLASATGLTVSLVIETGQGWIPSRTSSLLDLILNTAGTGGGALAFLLVEVALRAPERRGNHSHGREPHC